jgi:uncharacterized protein with HEPN domain
MSLYLEDILNAIGKIERYSQNLTHENFIADDRTLDEVSHNLQIIGEAVKDFSEVKNIVAHAASSQELKTALEKSKQSSPPPFKNSPSLRPTR